MNTKNCIELFEFVFPVYDLQFKLSVNDMEVVFGGLLAHMTDGQRLP